MRRGLIFIVALLLISAEELPPALSDELRFLQSAIERTIRQVDPNLHIGVEVVSLKTGEKLYQKNSQQLFTPASVQKIFTAASALTILGPDFSFSTSLFTDQQPTDGIIRDLYLKGSGDPSLVTQDLEHLVLQLTQQGISQIEGDLLIDNFDFDAVTQGPGWMWDEEAEYWNSPLDALLVNHSCVTVSVEPRKVVPVKSPSTYAAQLLKEILQKKGIQIGGKICYAQVPEEAFCLATHTSKPVKDLIVPVLKQSDNLYANCLFKKMGQQMFGAPGTWQKGAKAVKELLSINADLDTDNLIIVDGDGESRYNLVSPDQLVTFLAWMEKHSSTFPEFLEALPVSSEGNLQKRIPDIQGCIRAKPGTMTGISALAGYATTTGGETLAFAILMNGFIGPEEKYKKGIEDEICRLITQYNSAEPSAPAENIKDCGCW